MGSLPKTRVVHFRFDGHKFDDVLQATTPEVGHTTPWGVIYPEFGKQLSEEGSQLDWAVFCRSIACGRQLFMACLCNLQAAQILSEVDTDRLFSNVPELYVAQRQFWAEHVVPMLKKARHGRQPLDPTVLRPAFLRFDQLLHPYTKYCLDQTTCQQYCKEKDHDNELFKAYLAVSWTRPGQSRARPALTWTFSFLSGAKRNATATGCA